MGSLFAGIGGFDLGFERAGFETAWQVEIDLWCRKVLAKNFPKAERYADIRDCGAHNLGAVDVIVGGFPCQDISLAGAGAGIEGECSGLVTEMVRIISELRPSYVLMENVAALLGRGLREVLGYLAEIGYDAEWEIVSAADVGAPHLRERVWILAYSRSAIAGSGAEQLQGGQLADRKPTQLLPKPCGRGGEAIAGNHYGAMADAGLADPSRTGCQELDAAAVAVAEGFDTGCAAEGRLPGWWAVEPSVGRVAHGIPKRVDRLRGLGNAVVPQIPEMYARRISQLLKHDDLEG